MNNIYIYSCGGSGREILRLIKDINDNGRQWNVLGYIDDDIEKQGTVIDGLNVFSFEEMPRTDNDYCICGIMDPSIREKIVEQNILPKGYQIPSLIHPTISIYDDTQIEHGAIIYSGVYISYNVKIDKYALLSSNSLIGHDSIIGKYVSVMPATTINGNCNIGDKCILGAGSVLHPGISIGQNSVIGIGSKVLNNVDSNKTLLDTPRRVILDRKKQ